MALRGTLAADDIEFARDFGDTILHAAAVGFQLRFTVTAHADAALLARQVTPEPRQAGEQMLKLREFDLQLAFFRACTLRKNIKNERCAIENLAIENTLEIAALRGGKFVVENDGIHVLAAAVFGEFAGFAAADERAGDRGIELLGAVANDLTAGGGGELGKFVERIAHDVRAPRFEFYSDEEDSFRPFGGSRD